MTHVVHEQPVRTAMKRKYSEFKVADFGYGGSGSSLGMGDAKFIKGQSPAQFGTDAKRTRLTPFQSSLPIRRNPLEVLEEALVLISQGDRQRCGVILREFAVDHVSTLEGTVQERAAETLVAIARMSKYADIGRLAMRYLQSLMERMECDAVARAVTATVEEDEDAENRILARHFLDSAVLGIVEMAIRRGACIVFPEALLQVGSRSLRALDDHQRRTAALLFQAARCLKLAGGEGRDETADNQLSWLQKTLCDGTKDRDPRVRMAAVEGLREMADEGALSIEVYPTVRQLCSDSEPSVRLACLHIMLACAQRFGTAPAPTTTSSSSSSMRMSLADDSFSVVCHSINDMEIGVRAEAAKLLGDFDDVSDVLLDQTLDKKLMKMTTTGSGAKIGVRTKESLFALRKREKPTGRTDWASGKQLNEVAPGERPGSTRGRGRKEVEEEEESIIPQGACGAFITALEDEFMSVRKAGVYSLGKLASTRPSFAATALDHLADMFNDEIEEVRLDSIRALTPLVSRGELFKEQLETIIKCLDDANHESRSALRRLLCKAQFADVECVKLCVRSLMTNMLRYPADKMEIYETMAELGRRHSTFVQAMVTGLLDLHPVFASQEKPLQDTYYVAKLIMVLNAAAECEPIVSLLPDYTLRHFRYMRGAMPHLVPVIPTVAGREKKAAEAKLTELRSKWAGPRPALLEEVYDRLVEVEATREIAARNSLRKYIIEDLSAISSLNSTLAAPSRLSICIASTVNALEAAANDALIGGEMATAAEMVEKELYRVVCMETQYTRVAPAIQAFLVELRLHLVLFRALVALSTPPIRYVQIAAELREQLADVDRRYVECGVKPSAKAAEVRTVAENALTSGKAISTIVLADALFRCPVSLPRTVQGLKEVQVKWAAISEPESEVWMEKPLRFVSVLPTCIGFMAELHHLEEGDLERFRVQVEYPNESQSLFRPRRSEMEKINEDTTRVRTNVLLGASCAWSDPADVRLTAVLLPQSATPSSSSSSNCMAVPLPNSQASSQPASVLIRMQPLLRAGGSTNTVTGTPRDGVVGI